MTQLSINRLTISLLAAAVAARERMIVTDLTALRAKRALIPGYRCMLLACCACGAYRARAGPGQAIVY